MPVGSDTSMVENPAAPIIDKVGMAAKKSPSRPQPNKKGKVPKRIHKAEREKMKREHLNDLFLALASAVEVSEQTNGKACVLSEACRIVKDVLSQIENLKKENAVLLSESQYITMETKELQDENTVLATQIEKLQNDVKERAAESQLDLNVAPPAEFYGLPALESYQQPQAVNSVYVIPFCSNPQVCPDVGASQAVSTTESVVKKPQARYPTSNDRWSSQILEKLPEP